MTLHRAFDMCKDPFEALDQARSLGVNTILTSGQSPSCLEGIERMKELTGAAGKDLTILAGAGINAHAVEILLEQTDLTAFHMSGKRVLNSGMAYRNPAVSMGLPGLSEYELWQPIRKCAGGSLPSGSRCKIGVRLFLCSSTLALPVKRAIGGQLASAPEIMDFAGDQVNCLSASRIEMRGKRFSVRVNRHQTRSPSAARSKMHCLLVSTTERNPP